MKSKDKEDQFLSVNKHGKTTANKSLIPAGLPISKAIGRNVLELDFVEGSFRQDKWRIIKCYIRDSGSVGSVYSSFPYRVPSSCPSIMSINPCISTTEYVALPFYRRPFRSPENLAGFPVRANLHSKFSLPLAIAFVFRSRVSRRE